MPFDFFIAEKNAISYYIIRTCDTAASRDRSRLKARYCCRCQYRRMAVSISIWEGRRGKSRWDNGGSLYEKHLHHVQNSRYWYRTARSVSMSRFFLEFDLDIQHWLVSYSEYVLYHIASYEEHQFASFTVIYYSALEFSDPRSNGGGEQEIATRAR